jgi:hypothetical protein
MTIAKPDPNYVERPQCHLICREVRRHTPECDERQAEAARITAREAQPTGDHDHA